MEFKSGPGLGVGRGGVSTTLHVLWKGASLGLACWWSASLLVVVLMDSSGRWEPAGHP